MAANADVKELVERMPELDKADAKDKKKSRNAGKLTGPQWAQAEKICDAILAGGAGSIVGVIDMLAEVDDGKDYKARYVLHALAMYVCRPGKAGQRRMVVEAIASQLGGRRPKAIQRFLIGQLQLCADGRVAARLGGLLADEKLCASAAAALLAIGNGAGEQFRAALPRAKAGSRLTIVQSLGAVADAAAVDALRGALADQDGEVRLAAAWGLARLGDAGSIKALIGLADAKGPPWQRIQATKTCLLLAESLQAAGRKSDAARVYSHLRDTRTSPAESHVRQAAESALGET